MNITQERAHQAWRHAEQLKKLSDRLIGIGPFGIGMDTVLSLVYPAGLVYGALAGLFMMGHAIRARASLFTMTRMFAYLVINASSDSIPLVGQAFDAMFPGILMAAKALQKDIEARFGMPPEEAERRERKRWFKKKPKRGGVIEGQLVR